jgi:hypothetical protein
LPEESGRYFRQRRRRACRAHADRSKDPATSRRQRRAMRVRAILLAAVVAGAVSTLVQVALWLVFTDAFPKVLYRDARLAAALVAGPWALRRPDQFDVYVLLIATLVHFALSIAFAAPLAPLVSRCAMAQALARGIAFGAVLYFVNLHLVTFVFPWFEASRGAIAFVAHVAFGASAALTYHLYRPGQLCRL